MNCPKCSNPINEGELFCFNCGAKVEEQQFIGNVINQK